MSAVKTIVNIFLLFLLLDIMTEIKEFMSKFFEKYGLLDSCISSYNLICETLINII